jgi:hypothetical protein
MAQNLVVEGNRCSGAQKFVQLLWVLKCHYRVHKSPSPDHLLSLTDPFQKLTLLSVTSILILSPLVCEGVSSLQFFRLTVCVGINF